MGYSFIQQRFFYMHHPTDRIAHTTAFVTPVVEHWLEREIAQWVHPMKDRSDDPSHHELHKTLNDYTTLTSLHLVAAPARFSGWVKSFSSLSFPDQRKIESVDMNERVIMEGRKEGNILFNDALNTFYLQLYGVRHMVKNHSDSKKGRKEVFYLMTHLTHFILRLYGVRHMVKDHSDSEKGNPLPPHRLLFSINSKGSFICTIPQTG